MPRRWNGCRASAGASTTGGSCTCAAGNGGTSSVPNSPCKRASSMTLSYALSTASSCMRSISASITPCYPAMYLDKMEGNTIVLPTGGGGKWGPKRFPDIVAHLTEDPPVHFRRDASTTSAASGATVGTTSNWTRFVPNETSARKIAPLHSSLQGLQAGC